MRGFRSGDDRKTSNGAGFFDGIIKTLRLIPAALNARQIEALAREGGRDATCH